MSQALQNPDLLKFLQNEDRQPYHLVYVASPYWHNDAEVRDARALAALHATAEMISQGVPAFSAVAYSNHFQNLNLQTPLQGWYEYDLNYLAASDKMVVLELPGWQQSAGIAIETSFAASRSIPVTHIPYNQIAPLLTPELNMVLQNHQERQIQQEQPEPRNPLPLHTATANEARTDRDNTAETTQPDQSHQEPQCKPQGTTDQQPDQQPNQLQGETQVVPPEGLEIEIQSEPEPEPGLQDEAEPKNVIEALAIAQKESQRQTEAEQTPEPEEIETQLSF